jgi:hypothetical protein
LQVGGYLFRDILARSTCQAERLNENKAGMPTNICATSYCAQRSARHPHFGNGVFPFRENTILGAAGQLRPIDAALDFG